MDATLSPGSTHVAGFPAFVADEEADAIAIDQVLVTAGKATPKLMLPKRRMRYEYQDYPKAEAGETGVRVQGF